MADLVIDTDVVSYGFRIEPVFAEFYGPVIQGNRAIISFMTIAELEFGALNRNWGTKRLEALRGYLAANYLEYGVSQAVTRRWAELIHEAKRAGRILSTADAWIAATASVLSVPLVTNNARDFECLTKLSIITAP